MNMLINEIRRLLKEFDFGLKVSIDRFCIKFIWVYFGFVWDLVGLKFDCKRDMFLIFVLLFYFQGELIIIFDMEDLGNVFFMDFILESWNKKVYLFLYGLIVWYVDFLLRVKELEIWLFDFQFSVVVWFGGFFNL